MEYIAPILRYATLLAVAVSIVFGLAAVRHSRRLRYLTAAVEFVQSVQTDLFTRAMQRILELPPKAEAERVLEDSELVHAAYVVGHVFEGLGVLVYRRLLPIDLVDELIGGYLRTSWMRLAPYIERRRESFGPTFAEWFQWLVERAAELPHATNRLSAATVHRDWRPRRVY